LRHILVSDKIRNFNEINRLAFKSDRLLVRRTLNCRSFNAACLAMTP
jgi:hypothetical protein